MATATDTENGVSVTIPANAVGVVQIDRGGGYQVGNFLGLRNEEPREFGGRTYVECSIGLLVVGSVVAIQYRSRKSAEAAVGGAVRGDLVAIPAELKHGVGRDNRPYGFFVEPSGREVDATEFGD